MDLTPILTVACLFLWDIHHSQIQHFQETIVGRKYRLGFGDLLELTVKSSTVLVVYIIRRTGYGYLK